MTQFTTKRRKLKDGRYLKEVYINDEPIGMIPTTSLTPAVKALLVEAYIQGRFDALDELANTFSPVDKQWGEE